MNEQQARKILIESISGSNLSNLNPYIHWYKTSYSSPEFERVGLDGEFSIEELKAII